MEYNSSLPIYLQVANLIKRDIVTGKRELGEKLPSVRELAVSYREGEKYERRDGGDADP